MLRTVSIPIFKLKHPEVIWLAGRVIGVIGKEMGEYFGTIDTFPHKSMVGKGIELVPGDFLCHEIINTRLFQDLRQCSAIAEDVWQPQVIHIHVKLFLEETLPIQ